MTTIPKEIKSRNKVKGNQIKIPMPVQIKARQCCQVKFNQEITEIK